MQKQGSILVFDYPGGQITFHEDLKKYYQIQEKFRAKIPELQACINMNKEPQKMLDDVSSRLFDIVTTDTISPLSKFGVYNLTQDDFLQRNPGYLQMLRIVNSYYKSIGEVNSQVQQMIQQGQAQAKSEAASTITGSGYSLYSNDLLAHAIYAAQNERILKRQAARADWEVYKATRNLEKEGYRVISKAEQEKKQKEVIPALMDGVSNAIEYIILIYCQKLSKVGQIDINCLNGIDEKRSDILLQNIEVVDSRDELIYNAIQLCPYNHRIYEIAYNYDAIFGKASKEILQFFGITEWFCQFVRAEKFPKEDESVVSYLPKIDRGVQVIAFLSDYSKQDLTGRVLRSKFEKDVTYYQKFANLIFSDEDDAFANELAAIFPGTRVRRIENRLERLLKEQHLTNEEISIYNDNGLRIFDHLSNLFHQSVSTFDEADQIILSAWEVKAGNAIKREEIQDHIEDIKNSKETLEENLKKLQNKRSTYSSKANDLLLYGGLGFLGLAASGFGISGGEINGLIVGIGLGAVILLPCVYEAKKITDIEEEIETCQKEIIDKQSKLELLNTQSALD